MREIKFRLLLRNMVVGYEVHRKGEAIYVSVMHSPDGEDWKNILYSGPILHDDKVQFTGLRDKNGKEIYEGDIVACIENKFGEGRHEYWEVVYGYFGDAAFYVSNQLNSGRLLEIADYSDSVVFSADGTEEITCEVIGNIFENPEMTRT